MISYFSAILLSLILGGQPYILIVDKATPFLESVCRKSAECMDIEEIEKETP